MLKDVVKRRNEGWRFAYGIDGYQYVPAGKTEIIMSNYLKTFESDEEALEWVKRCASRGSIYHQRAIEYVIAAQMCPKTVIRNRQS